MAAQARMQSTFSCPIDISKSERESQSRKERAGGSGVSRCDTLGMANVLFLYGLCTQCSQKGSSSKTRIAIALH